MHGSVNSDEHVMGFGEENMHLYVYTTVHVRQVSVVSNMNGVCAARP